MKIYNRLSSILLAATLCVSAIGFTSCNDNDDDFGTEQYVGGIHLNVFGPSPVARGGELRFLGSGMNQITSIEIPGCDPITDIKVVSDSEIRVTVPQTAQPGTVTLNFAKGSIVTKTKLSYLEPISIESFSPAKVKAGDKLTIKGEYLNLIKEVIFSDDVTVGYADFTNHSRSEIQVIVPLEARTGKFIISDGDEDLPNWIYSDTELEVVLPAVAKPADLTDAKPGDVVTIEGTDLDLVVDILMPNGESVDFTYADGKITFVLPENVSDGAILAVAPSGVHVAIANIGVVMPGIEHVSPSVDLRPGDVITITGTNLDQVVSINFPNVGEAVVPDNISATSIKVAMPDMAQSGVITLNLKSGKTNSDIELATAKPEVQAFTPNPVAAAGEFTMTGKNLDLIAKVTFGGNITVEASTAIADKLTLTAPATAESGALTLTMANGETVETAALTIDAPQCAFITEVLSEELLGGELMIVTVNNGDKLTEVQVNGTVVNHLYNNGKLYIALPQMAGKGTVVTLVSSNGSISYTYDVTPATHIENVIWQGMFECTSWNGNQDLAYGGFDWSTLPAGATLTFYMTPLVDDGSWWCLALRHGDGWTNLPGDAGAQYDSPADGIATLVLTQEILDDLVKNMGLIIFGQGYILTKITASWDISLETTLWEGEAVVDDWKDQPYVLSDAGLELASVGAKAGQTVYLYFKTLDSDWKIEILEGHWGPSYGAWCAFGSDTESGKFTEYDLAGNGGRIGIKLTQEMLDAAYVQQWWGGVFVLNGDNLVCTKITIE